MCDSWFRDVPGVPHKLPDGLQACRNVAILGMVVVASGAQSLDCLWFKLFVK